MLHDEINALLDSFYEKFQRAPTLEGECYVVGTRDGKKIKFFVFQRAPTLEGECYNQQ